MAENTLRIEDGRVTIVRPFRWLAAALGTLLPGVIIYALLVDGVTETAHMILFAVAVLGWLLFVAGLKTTTVFDAAAGKVYRRNLLWPLRTVDFADVDGVVFVGENVGWGRRVEYYKIALRGDRFGKGCRLTRDYAGADVELAVLRTTALPAIEAMLAPTWEAAAADAPPAGIPERLRHFVRRGDVYTRTMRKKALAAFLVGVALILSGLVGGTVWGVGLGALIAFTLGLLPVARVDLDNEQGVVVARNCFGLRVQRQAPYDAFLGVAATRHYTNYLYTGTSLDMRFDGHKNIRLASTFFTRSLGSLADETEAIIGAYSSQ